MGASIITLLTPALLEISMQSWLRLLPKDQGEPIESIIILGRGANTQTERALAASQIWHERQGNQIFVSGMTDAPPIIKTLQQMGVPATQVNGERCSQTTWENGLFSSILLNAPEGQPILLMTDELHMVRAFLVFRGFGFDVTPYPVKWKAHSFPSLRRWRVLFREHAALIMYAIEGKFRLGSEEKQHQTLAEANDKIARWGCHLTGEANYIHLPDFSHIGTS